MPTDTSVTFFQNTMSGAPDSNGDPGTFVGIFDACLVNGFGSVTLDSLVIADNVATGTVSTGHGFAMTGATGPVIRIEGATPSGLNGDWRIQTVPNSTTFTLTTSGISNQTATGTITAKRAPAGFEKVFSGTNKAVYRSLDSQGTQTFLRVDDSSTASTAYTAIRMFTAMSDVDTGDNGGTTLYVLRKAAGYNFNRNWRIFADGRAFYFTAESLNSNSGWYGSGHCFFGDLVNPVPNSVAVCGLSAFASEATNGAGLATMDHDGTGTLTLSYNGITRNVGMRRRGHLANSGLVGNGGGSYLAAIGVLVKAVEAWEGTTTYRGLMPGWYGQVHPALWTWFNAPYEHEQIGTLWGTAMYSSNTDTPGQFFDLTGPWR